MAQLGLVGSLHPFAKALLSCDLKLENTSLDELKVLKDFECRTRHYRHPALWHFENTGEMDQFEDDFPGLEDLLREACNYGELSHLLEYSFQNKYAFLQLKTENQGFKFF